VLDGCFGIAISLRVLFFINHIWASTSASLLGRVPVVFEPLTRVGGFLDPCDNLLEVRVVRLLVNGNVRDSFDILDRHVDTLIRNFHSGAFGFDHRMLCASYLAHPCQHAQCCPLCLFLLVLACSSREAVTALMHDILH
jgi:hypothetical protein